MTISASVKQKVWDYWIGAEKGIAKCYCCNLNDIRQLSFTAGHVTAASKGGLAVPQNLRPICSFCNSSMYTKHMGNFMRESGYEDLDEKDSKRLVQLSNSIQEELARSAKQEIEDIQNSESDDSLIANQLDIIETQISLRRRTKLNVKNESDGKPCLAFSLPIEALVKNMHIITLINLCLGFSLNIPKPSNRKSLEKLLINIDGYKLRSAINNIDTHKCIGVCISDKGVEHMIFNNKNLNEIGKGLWIDCYENFLDEYSNSVRSGWYPNITCDKCKDDRFFILYNREKLREVHAKYQ